MDHEKKNLLPLKDTIPLDCRLNLGEFQIPAWRLPTLDQQPELGPLSWNNQEVALEVNGSVIGWGRVEFTSDDLVFTLTNLTATDSENKLEEDHEN